MIKIIANLFDIRWLDLYMHGKFLPFYYCRCRMGNRRGKNSDRLTKKSRDPEMIIAGYRANIGSSTNAVKYYSYS